MLTEELNCINDAEIKAEALKKDAKANAKAMVEQATVEASEKLSNAEREAKDYFDRLMVEGNEIAEMQYQDAIKEAKYKCVQMVEKAGGKQEDVVNFIVERIVEASVNS